jgi:hypothetical protein
VPLGADNYDVAFDPQDPETIYMETQVSGLVRYDRRTGEAIGVQPQPGPGDPPERWNWDASVLVSPQAPPVCTSPRSGSGGARSGGSRGRR